MGRLNEPASEAVADLLHDVRLALERMREVERRLEAMLPPAPEVTDAGGDLEPLIDTWAAAERFGYPQDTIRKWCREGCGKRQGGRWLASIPRIQQRINGAG